MRIERIETPACDAGWRTRPSPPRRAPYGLSAEALGDDELSSTRPVIEGGHIAVPEAPGWGTQPIEEARTAYLGL